MVISSWYHIYSGSEKTKSSGYNAIEQKRGMDMQSEKVSHDS